MNERMRWSSVESAEIHELLSSNWPGQMSPAQWNSMQRALGRFHGRTVITAIKCMADEGESHFRPRPPVFAKTCSEIAKARARGAGYASDGRCPWCRDLYFAFVWAYRLEGYDRGKYDIPASDAIQRIPGQNAYVVRPDVAAQLGLEAKRGRLDCGHCTPRFSRRTVQEWDRQFGKAFVEFRDPGRLGEMETYDRCCRDEPPRDDEEESREENFESLEERVPF